MDATVGSGVARVTEQGGPAPSLVRLEELVRGGTFGLLEALEAGDVRTPFCRLRAPTRRFTIHAG
jgi:hypothetical protein